MGINLIDYYENLKDNNINIIYSGPIWGDGVEGISATLKKVMEFDQLSLTASKSIFAVFVEQMNNMLMYSAEKEAYDANKENSSNLSRGIFILGTKGKTYFLKSGNIIKNASIKFLKDRIDLLNSLDKEGIKKLYKEQIRSENNNPESLGAGIGLTEIARRSNSKITYNFEPYGEGTSFFSMDVTVKSDVETEK